MRGIHRWPVYYPKKGTLTRKRFPFDDIIVGKHLLLAFVRRNPLVIGELPLPRTEICSFDEFFVVSQNKLLNKPSSCCWFQTLQSSCDIIVIEWVETRWTKRKFGERDGLVCFFHSWPFSMGVHNCDLTCESRRLKSTGYREFPSEIISNVEIVGLSMEWHHHAACWFVRT